MNIKMTLKLFLFCCFIQLFSCKKDFGDTNINPDPARSSFANTAHLLTNTINALSTAGISSMVDGIAIYNFETAQYAQYLSASQYPEASLYSTTHSYWDNWYSGIGGPNDNVKDGSLEDLYIIIKYNTDSKTASDPRVLKNGSNNNQLAVARILKAYLFSIVTDRWGDVPYFDALKGITTPKYDKQSDIYKDLFKELREAIAQFDNGAKPTGDNLFGGNIEKWKKFANSLRMILALRISKSDIPTAKTEFIDAYNNTNGFINTNAENAKYIYLENTAFCNPWNSLYNNRDDYGVSNIMVDWLLNNNDPRINVFAQKNMDGVYKGIPYGLSRSALINWISANDYSRMGEKITGWQFNGSTPSFLNYKGADGYIITAAQMWLTKAEAESKGWIGSTSDAVISYTQAIKLSWDQWNVTYTPAQFSAYLAQPTVDPTTNIGAKIGQQKWLALYPNGQEAWTEWRRSGYPLLLPAPDAVNTSKQIPRRFGYPSNEAQLNSINYAAQVATMPGGDIHDVHVWWDKP